MRDREPPIAASAPIKCLVVDDRDENLLALSALLSRDDVEVLQARSGTEALELLLVHPVALAFLDVQMPQMDGFELAELIRGSPRTCDVPLIFVTAGNRDQHRLFKGYESGAVDFLYKPIEPHVLTSKAEVFFKLYRQKQQLARDLEERTETLHLNELFVAMLGHDLRNPLSAILTSASNLERHPTDAAVRKVGSRILSSSRRMARMIEDMLDVARARLGGGIPLDLQDGDLDAAVMRVVDEHGVAFPAPQVEVARRGAFAGRWDAGRIGQVVSNLLANAVHHGDGAEPVRVDLDGSGDDAVVFSVRNAGEIPAEVLPHVFDPFRSGEVRSGQLGGLGLGLYIVQQIVLAHAGRIDLLTTDAGYTTFRITLPRRLPTP